MRAPEGTDPPVRDPEVVRAQNRAQAEAATSPRYNIQRDNLGTTQEQQATREWGRGYQEYGAARELLNEAPLLDRANELGINPAAAPARTGDMARAEAAAIVAQSVQRREGGLMKYPTLLRAVVEAAAAGQLGPNGERITFGDVTRLLNYAEVDRAARMFLAVSKTWENMPEERERWQKDLLLSYNGPMRIAILDAANALSVLNTLESADSNMIVDFLGNAAEKAMWPFVVANETMQHAFRASIDGQDLGDMSMLDAARIGASNIANPAAWGEAWNTTEAGNFDMTYIETLKASGEYSPLSVDIVLAISKYQAEGSTDPITDAMADFADTPGAAEVFYGLIYRGGEDPKMTELVRQVDSANRGSTGQMWTTGMWTPDASVYSMFRGSQVRETTANAASVFYAFALDPTIPAAGAFKAYRAGRWALLKLAPGSRGESAVRVLRSQQRAGREWNAARRYMDSFFEDLAKYDEMLQVDAAKAATMRTVLARQYKEFPEDAIEEIRLQGLRTTDDFAAFVDDTNDAWLVAHGEPTVLAREQAERVWPVMDSTFAQNDPLAYRMFARGDMGRREALIPTMSLGRRLRQLGAQQISTRVMPSQRGRAVIDAMYGNTNDAATVAGSIMDNAFDAGRMDQRWLGAGAVGRRVDGITRLFASLPNVSHITTFDARDAGVFYKFARTYLTRQHATYLTNAFRDANPAQRRLMIAGLIRTAAGARGVNVSKAEVLRQIDDLSTVTRTGELYSAERTLRLSAAPGGVERPWEPIDQLASKPLTLYHGTNRNFDTLSESAAPRARHAVPRPDGKRNIYFTDNLDEANRFARESGDAAVLPEMDMNRAAYDDLIAQHGSPEAAVDWAMQQFDFYGDVWDDAAKAWVYRKMTKDEVVTNWMDGSSPYGYPKGTAPRVIEQQIDGPVLDFSPLFRLTGKEYDDWVAANVPDGLQQALRDEGTFDAVFNRFGGTNWGGHERSAVLGNWAWDNGYAAIKVPDKVKGGYSYIVNPKQLEPRTPQSTLAAVEDTVVYRPSNFDGEEHALHLWQTTQAVAIPSIADMEALKAYRQFIPRGLQRAPQQFTDVWSVYTLAGLRFALRSAIEDLWVSAVTSGSLPLLWRGRRSSTGIREARARVTVLKHKKGKLEGQPVIFTNENGDQYYKLVTESRLGMFGKRARRVGDMAVSREGRLADIWSTFFLPNLNEEDVIRAAQAARNGDIRPMQRLVVQAVNRQRLTGMSDEQLAFIGDLVDTPFGFAHLDDLAEAGQLMSRGTLPKELPVQGMDLPGVEGIIVPKRDAGVMGDYLDVPAQHPWYGMFWFNSVEGIVENDGPIGKIAVSLLDNRQAAINAVARAINDDTTFGYMQQFSAIYSGKATVEQFAARYVDDVRAMFSNENGVINQRLWDLVAPLSDDGTRNVSMYEMVEGQRVLKFTAADMYPRFQSGGRPEFVLGREKLPIPTAGDDRALLLSPDKLFTWMGEQYARISKEPLFLANYLKQRELLAGYQSQLAERIGEQAAARLTANMAADRAYGFVLAYTDNPANRSQLAWKVRNVSRYYRATEDFYRRMQRLAKNYPEAFWKTALTYQTLDETGFIFTDDNGDKYFAYPGNEFLTSVITNIWGYISHTGSMEIDPFFMGGKVKMIAPSTDPNQMVATVMGPAVVPVSFLFDMFPQFRGLERYVVGEYAMNNEWYEALIPGQVHRVLQAFNTDERQSIYANAMMDAMAVAAAAGIFQDQELAPDGTITPGMTSMSGLRFSDEFRTLQTIAMGVMITKSLMGFLPLPASAQVYTDDVTLFARAHGMDNMRDGFLDLVEQADKAGAVNPFADAIVQWFSLHPTGDLMPFTVGTTKDAPDRVESLAAVESVVGLRTWFRENKDLYEKYPAAALFLAPRGGERSWGSWDLVKSTLGLKVTKSFEEFMRGVLVAEDQANYYATLDDFNAELATLDPEVDKARMREVIAEKDHVLGYLKDVNPLLKEEVTRNFQQWDQYARDAYQQTKAMTYELYDTPRATPESRAIADAIATFEDYMGDILAISGTTNAEDELKRSLRTQLEAQLAQLGAANPNVQQFVDSVLGRLIYKPGEAAVAVGLVGSAA